MSRHDVAIELDDPKPRRLVYGWDNALKSFYLRIYEFDAAEDANPIVSLGDTEETKMTKVQELISAVENHGEWNVDHEMKKMLQAEQAAGG